MGGTKLAAAVIDGSGDVLARARAPVPETGDGERVLAELLGCARAVVDESRITAAGLAGVGVACAGPLDRVSGRVSPLNLPAWQAFPLRDRLAEELGCATVAIDIDAVCIAAGEHWVGAARGLDHVLAVTVSTGIGAGLLLGGRLHRGTSGNAGHVGHVVVEPDGPACACGGLGCLEAVASGPRTVARALARGWSPESGRQADGGALAASAAGGDPIAREEIARSGRALGRALASCAALLDLEAIVVVGGFSRSGEALWGPMRSSFAEYAALPFAAACRLVAGALGDDAGLVGAAAFVLAAETSG